MVKRMSTWRKIEPLIRPALLVIFLSLTAVFVAYQYELVRDTVRFVCINCLGLGG